jgi:murein DD-endopeptidase MepM/ murein hydrolase activator NlpD
MRRSFSVTLLALAAYSGCGDASAPSSSWSSSLPDGGELAFTASAVTQPEKIRMGCDVILGEGSGPTLDTCISYYPESISRIDFVADIPTLGYVEWTFSIPAGEPLRVLAGCHRWSSTCQIEVRPRCDVDRVYRANVRYSNGSSAPNNLGTATATVPRAACSAPPPPAGPPLVPHPECTGVGRDKLCAYDPNALEGGQCDGLGQCIDCVDNGGCNESSVCTSELRCALDTSVLPPYPPRPPAPQPLPPGSYTPPPPPPPPPTGLKIRCSVAPGGALTEEQCTAPFPQSVTSITFEVPPNSFETTDTIYQWGVQMPDGEPFARKNGCFNDRFCTIDVRPKTGGTARTYRASLAMTEEFNLERVQRFSATATVGPAPGPGLALGPAELDINPVGGGLTLPDLASVSIPFGAFISATRVRLEGTRTANADAAWDFSSGLFGAVNRTAHEVRITASERPQVPIDVTITVPPGYAVVPNTRLSAFAQVIEGSDSELHDLFDVLPSAFSAQNGTVRVVVPPEAFTDLRSGQSRGQFEAVLLLANTPIRRSASAAWTSADTSQGASLQAGEPMAPNWPAAAAAGDACPVAQIGSPLRVPLVVSSRYVVDVERPHKGLDVAVPVGTPVVAMADGTVERIKFNLSNLNSADTRTQLNQIGFGQYLVIRHDDAPARSLYAHLRADGLLVNVGDRVVRGQVIALSGNTGGSTKPHLHVEYIPYSEFAPDAERVDPELCINPDLPPSPGGLPLPPPPGGIPAPVTRTIEITISDAGSVLDDAFEVFLNNQTCRSAPGGTRVCTFTGIRPGTIRPNFFCIQAPDGLGTLGVQLGRNLVFTGTGTTFTTFALNCDGRSAFFPQVTVF